MGPEAPLRELPTRAAEHIEELGPLSARIEFLLASAAALQAIDRVDPAEARLAEAWEAASTVELRARVRSAAEGFAEATGRAPITR